MSAAPAPGPRDAKQQQPQAQPPEEPKPKPVLIFDDPLDQQSADDTDRGWGERPSAGSGAADLARFLDEKPPHHI
ncbi:hypothetical protein ACTFBT_15920 [Streptomyces microflavus]|jgi:hypothetical protein|uniref:Uncharacterized protein n=2 Tax=Streptomyces microflavus TaxID=1919 RepID=A0A7J0CRT0_STRMI|nr:MULTISPECIES: hypothetical protein [Streptomyces]AGK77785.1 hypothetical protein SFUL_2844 [Streptomyces microflavus DSM 40593]MCX4653002.1 hypothetical protein [Streptomyces microflavus]MDX2981174.1 hypothetical protein [Streptomyces sp. NRRL_B-2249]WSA61273.1 hypothetical protein OHB31_14340 [Streptomyces microflavus]WSS36067.1 hypothetical protein OG269_22635 [Streptomyces microflavus]